MIEGCDEEELPVLPELHPLPRPLLRLSLSFYSASYTTYVANGTITMMNATVVVPSNPNKMGANPSFWYGLQTAKGDGALIQPILAWGQTYTDGFGIFHEVFDWNNQVDSRSAEHYRVYPGDVLTQSVVYKPEDNSYDMYIASKKTGKSILWNYKLEKEQNVPETTAFIVVEHGLVVASCSFLVFLHRGVFAVCCVAFGTDGGSAQGANCCDAVRVRSFQPPPLSIQAMQPKCNSFPTNADGRMHPPDNSVPQSLNPTGLASATNSQPTATSLSVRFISRLTTNQC
jgi:hypothetical protein